MTQEGFKRKLTAILSADAVGYSRLMREDEEATVRDIAVHRVLISEIVQQHHGRIVDSPGDNILAEFASVVDAVNGAIKIQQEIKKNNADTLKDRRMEFRIGINLGDVIEEEERIYGDGVNIAARVEGLASAGGIAISGTVYEHIKEKLSLGYHYLGEQDVKNISEPVRVYWLLTEPDDAGKMIGEGKSKSKRLRYVASGALALIILIAGTLVIWNNYIRAKIEPASIDKMAFPLAYGPNNADAHALFANILRFSGRFEEADMHIQEAMRLSPYHKEWYLWELGMCYYYLGRYEEMLEIGRNYLKIAESRKIKNMAFGGHFISSLSLVRLGKIEEARSHMKKVLKIYPFYSVWFDRQVSYYKNPKDLEIQHKDLRKAGLPEYPPSQ